MHLGIKKSNLKHFDQMEREALDSVEEVLDYNCRVRGNASKYYCANSIITQVRKVSIDENGDASSRQRLYDYNDYEALTRLSSKDTDSFFSTASYNYLPASATLPLEIISMIFQYLDSSEDLFNCVLTCRKFAECAIPNLYFRPIILNRSCLLKLCRTLKSPNQFYPYGDLLERLNLSYVGEHVNKNIIRTFAKCNNIERITLVGCEEVDDSMVKILIEEKPNIHAVDLGGLKRITDLSILEISRANKNLQGLNVANCNLITDQSISTLAAACTSIRRIRLGKCDNILGRCVQSLATFSYSLLELDIDNCDELTDDMTDLLFRNCIHLRELRIANCLNITNNAFRSFASISYSNLRVLDFMGCRLLTDNALALICKGATKLRNLVIAKCPLITDQGALHIIKLTKTLHLLHLGHCDRLTDRSLVSIAQSCTRLRYVDVACCYCITDRSVIEFAHLPKLKRIGLVKCAQITDVAIYELAINRGRNLERAHLSYCTNLSLDAVFTLMYACQSLTHLSVTGVRPFLRPDLRPFRRPAPKDFTPGQEAIFCVFSGSDLVKCREYLLSLPRESLAFPNEDGQDEMIAINAFDADLSDAPALTENRF